VLSKALLKKAVLLAVVLVALMIGLQMISGISEDRLRQRANAVESIRQSSAGPQVLGGPVIARTCIEERKDSKTVDGKTVVETHRSSHELRAFPARLTWRGDMVVEPRRRSLYTVNTYRATLNADVAWESLSALMPVSNMKDTQITCSTPRLEVILSDQRGIQSASVTMNEKSLKLNSGSGASDVSSGFSVTMDQWANLDAPSAAAAKPSAQIKLDLLGMESLAVLPVAEDTQLSLASLWPHPSFMGSFLPREKNFDKGFSATWRVSSLATSAQTKYPCMVSRNKSGEETACGESMAVTLVDPVNASALSNRAVKYGELFIALTFVGIGLFELLRRVKVHPIQYLLIGAALAVFFLLLLSVSEHLSFVVGYGLAALGCTALIAVYAKSVLAGWRGALPLIAGCATLYGVLYLVLQSEQHALLAGSLLIFVVLAAVMLATRNIQWSQLNANE
jgi:inner membrane protein